VLPNIAIIQLFQAISILIQSSTIANSVNVANLSIMKQLNQL